jgi:hypothetical protein
MIGIPLFLIILAEVGKLLSRGLRKLYKKMHKMKKIPEAARKMSEPMKVIIFIILIYFKKIKAIYNMTSNAVGPLSFNLNNNNNNQILEIEKEELKIKNEIKVLFLNLILNLKIIKRY